MKVIRLRPEALAILRTVAGSSPHKPLSVEEMRRRVRILDAIDELPADAEELTLEDEDQKTLAAAVDGFPWASASKSLLAIIDDVLQAKPCKAD